jgi:hypothetical protein
MTPPPASSEDHGRAVLDNLGSMKTRWLLGSTDPIEIGKAGFCRVCGHKAVGPSITIRIDRRWLLVTLCLALYVLLDIADSGHLDGSIARHALSFIFGTHP